MGRHKVLIAAAALLVGAVIIAGGLALYGVVAPSGPGPGDFGLDVPSENNVPPEGEAEGPGPSLRARDHGGMGLFSPGAMRGST